MTRALRFALRFKNVKNRPKTCNLCHCAPLLSAYTTRKNGRKRAIFQKPFKHIKIYLACDLTTKYQVIPPINGRETKEKRKKKGRKREVLPFCTTPERLYHAQKGSKTWNFPKPFKHIKIYLECGLFTKYQVIPPINGREITKKRVFFFSCFFYMARDRSRVIFTSEHPEHEPNIRLTI